MSSLKITVFYVGDGDCILVEFPDGSLGLVDSNVPAWSTSSPALDVIRTKGRPLEFVCLTHPHRDHFAGMLELLSTSGIQVNQFWHTLTDLTRTMEYFNTGRGYADPAFDVLARRFAERQHKELVDVFRFVAGEVRQSRIEPRTLREYQVLPSIGGVELWSLAPSGNAVERYTKRVVGCLRSGRRISQSEANEISAVLLLRYGAVSVVLGGDAPGNVWGRIVRSNAQYHPAPVLSCRAVKVAHHGAKDCGYAGMWKTLSSVGNENFAVISAGSPFHPDPMTLQALQAAGWKIYKTGLGGPTYPTSGPSQQRGIRPLAGLLLDIASSPADDEFHPCCGNIAIEVSDSGSVTVQTERQPACGVCG